MSKQYGILLIGCGHIGQQHLEDIYYRDNIRVVGVVDQDADRARQFARRYGAGGCGTDYRPFLNNPSVDIVIVASYVDTHLSITRDCLAHGKHVLCEKPIAGDLDSGIEFFRLVQQSPCKVLIGHILRHNRSYQKIAALIDSGAIGQLKTIRMVQNHHALNWPRYKRLMEDCSPVVDCGVHYLDIMQWFSHSRIISVGGFSTRIDADAPRDNYGVINVQLDNGCVGYYEAGWSPNMASQNLKEFIGNRGRISLTLQNHRLENQEEGDLISLYCADNGEYRTINVPATYKDMYAQLSMLIRMIEEDISPIPSLEEAFSAFYAALFAERAIQLHTSLSCPSLDEILNAPPASVPDLRCG
ncbi:MAG: Gfo/Idh/MocA family oxidoreductase [Subdoligranulum sp.]|nr:Gfo/Idh/MocA family oxidoreductase [Subdoligranulum sp.]